MKLEFSWKSFKKYSDIKFHENPSSGSQIVPCGQMDGWTACQPVRQTERQTDMTKLIDACRSFANAPKHSTLNSFICSPITLSLCYAQIFSSAPVLKGNDFMNLTESESQTLYKTAGEIVWPVWENRRSYTVFKLNHENIWWIYPNLVMRVIAIWYHCCQIMCGHHDMS